MPFYPSTIYPASQAPVVPPSLGLSPTRLRFPPRSTSLTPRALARLKNRPPDIQIVPEPGNVIPPLPDSSPAVAAVNAWRKDDAVERWRRKVAAEERRKTQLLVIGNLADEAEAVDELKRLMDETILMEDFDLADLQLPIHSKRSGTPTRHLSDIPTPTTTDAHHISEIENNPILRPPGHISSISTSAAYANIRARATQAALAAEKRQEELTRRLRLSEQRFAYPPRQVGHSLGASLDTGRSGFPLPLARRAPSEHTLEITMEKATKSTWGLRKKSHKRAATLQLDTAAAARTPSPLPTRERSATLQVPPAHSPALTTSALSGTYSLTPIDLYATPSKAAALLGLFPTPPSATAATAGRLEHPRPPFARRRLDSNASSGSSAGSYWSNCFPSRPSMSSSRTKTSGTLPLAALGHVRSESVQQLFACGPAAEKLDSPQPFQGLLPCFRDSVSLPNLHAQHMRELLSTPTPPPRPPRNPNRPGSTSKALSPIAGPTALSPPNKLRKLGPSPLSGIARKLSLTRRKPTSTTELKRKQSAKRGMLGMPLRSASQTDLLLEPESPVAGRWPVPPAWGVRRDSGFAFPMPPGPGATKAERRQTREVWEAESERLRLRLSGVGGGSAES